MCVCVFVHPHHLEQHFKEDEQLIVRVDQHFDLDAFLRLGTHFTRFTGTKVQMLTQKRYAASAKASLAAAAFDARV